MSSTRLTQTQARTRLKRMVAWDADPTLTSDEVDELLALSRVADVYGVMPDAYDDAARSTAYVIGDLRVPPERNNHVYRCTTAGTTASSEPAWPTASGGTVTDGGAVWTEYGSAPWRGAWDLNRGAAEGWRWKAAAAANRFEFSTGGQSFKRDQVVAHCQQMAKQFAAKIVTSAVSQPVGGTPYELLGVNTEVLA